MKLIPPWLRRRAWLLVATIGLVVAAGTALGWNRGSVYHGQALFIVPSGATTQGPGGAYEAKTLAITYVNLIPEDEAIVRYVAKQANLSTSALRERLAVSTLGDTALVVVDFDGPSASVTRTAIGALVGSLTGRVPTSAAIPPGTLILAHSEVATNSTKPQTRSVWLLVLLGLGLGAILLAAMERVDARVDEADQLIGFTDATIVDLENTSPSLARQLFQRRFKSVDERVTLSPVSERSEDAATWVLERLRADASETELAALAGVSTGPAPIATDPSVTHLATGAVALVIPAGTRADAIRSSFDTLMTAEAVVRWIVFTPRKPKLAPQPAASGGAPTTEQATEPTVDPTAATDAPNVPAAMTPATPAPVDTTATSALPAPHESPQAKSVAP